MIPTKVLISLLLSFALVHSAPTLNSDVNDLVARQAAAPPAGGLGGLTGILGELGGLTGLLGGLGGTTTTTSTGTT